MNYNEKMINVFNVDIDLDTYNLLFGDKSQFDIMNAGLKRITSKDGSFTVKSFSLNDFQELLKRISWLGFRLKEANNVIYNLNNELSKANDYIKNNNNNYQKMVELNNEKMNTDTINTNITKIIQEQRKYDYETMEYWNDKMDKAVNEAKIEADKNKRIEKENMVNDIKIILSTMDKSNPIYKIMIKKYNLDEDVKKIEGEK